MIRDYNHVINLPLEPRTASGKTILGRDEVSLREDTSILDEAMEEFLVKNDDYDDASDALGLVGQVSDLWRKVVKIKSAVIDHVELRGEDVPSLLRDLFGHVLLAMYYQELYDRKIRDETRQKAAAVAREEQELKAQLQDLEILADKSVGPITSTLFRDSILAMKEDGDSWEDVHNKVDQIKASYGEPKIAHEAGSSSPREEAKQKFLGSHGCWWVDDGSWQCVYGNKYGREVETVCAHKNPDMDVWCTRPVHAAGRHSAIEDGNVIAWPRVMSEARFDGQ